MNFIFLLYIVLLIKLCSSKPYYAGPGYSNDRESDSSAMASHQKKRLLTEDSQMQEGSSLYDTPSRYRKYQSSGDSSNMRRDTKFDQSDFEVDGKERREFYDSNNAAAKDSSIEVILDPRAKKAVAVVENSPNGQAMYDLSGWKNADNQENGEQVVNLVYPAEKIQRKYNSEGYETGNYQASDSKQAEPLNKMKRNAENNADTVKRSAEAKTNSKQNDCPPHTQNTDKKNLIKEVKRETQQWSQEQITALHNSVLKANQDITQMSNLKAMLSEMGLIENNEKREVKEKDDEAIETKRDVQEFAEEDGDFNQDDSMLKRDDRALSDDEKWEIDVNNAPQEPIEKRDLKEEKEETDKKRSNEEEVLDSDLALDSSSREKRQNSDKKEELNAAEEPTKKEKRKLDDAEYDAQMESEIQTKIDAIKEKVKRDILEDQKRKRAKRFTNSNSNSGVGDGSNFKSSLRSRRNVNSENSELDEKSSKTNTRKKRAMIQEKQMIYRPFQVEQDEETELDGDFDDNKLYLGKRHANEDWQYVDSRGREFSPYAQSYYAQPSRNRRSFENDYVEDGAMNNKAAMKTREKYTNSFADQDASNSNSNEISDSEYFGSLPLSYNGELTRYKRVKRDNPYKS